MALQTVKPLAARERVPVAQGLENAVVMSSASVSLRVERKGTTEAVLALAFSKIPPFAPSLAPVGALRPRPPPAISPACQQTQEELDKGIENN